MVIVGAGFGGLFATRALGDAPVEVLLVDRSGIHLFQPLLYQVATGILSQGEIARPLREVIRHQPSARVLPGEVTDVDLTARTLEVSTMSGVGTQRYDRLIVRDGRSDP